nr:reverse transcriptase domain-containing protein [Tanacetum cinerariifolium]
MERYARGQLCKLHKHTPLSSPRFKTTVPLPHFPPQPASHSPYFSAPLHHTSLLPLPSTTLPQIDTEGRIKKKFKEQNRHFLGLGCDNIETDRTVRNVMSDLSRVKKDAAIADAAMATSGIDDDDDTSPMDSHPHEPRGSPRDPQTMPPRKSTRGNPPSLLTQDTVNRMIQESVEAVIRAEREKVQNEANRAEGPNVAPIARECTFADFIKCSSITFRGNEGAVGLIRWIKKTEMVFTVSKCTEANKVVFAAATIQDQALTWWNSQVATSRIEAMTRKTSSSRLASDQSSNPTSSTNPNPKGRNRRCSKQRIENSNLKEQSHLIVTMTDNHTMAELLRAPTEGYAKEIVVPPILAEQFKLKHNLINMMTTDQFFGLEKDNPHDHIRWGSPPVARKRTFAFYYHVGRSCLKIYQ